MLPRRVPGVEGKNVQLTHCDVAILRDLTRLYGMTAEQLARRHFGAQWTAYRRVSSLAKAGLITLHRPPP